MRILGAALAVAIVSILGTWWVASVPRVAVRDVRKAETILLRKLSAAGHVHRISIKGTGRIDGEAAIMLMSNDAPYKVEKLQGGVDFHWHSDWYEDDATIRYEPAGVRGGDVRLQYKFSTL